MKRPRSEPQQPVETSYLRHVDTRTKLALALLVSFAIMLPTQGLLVFSLAYTALIASAGLARRAWRQLHRVRWLLLIAFAADWLLVDLELAFTVTLRLALMSTAFLIVVATTRQDELRNALVALGLPERVAFSLAVAQRSVGDLGTEWRRIREAQRARGIDFATEGDSLSQRWRQRMTHAAGVVVPALVSATQRAWSAHEAAAMRGFGAPARAPNLLPLPKRDVWLLSGTVAAFITLSVWR